MNAYKKFTIITIIVMSLYGIFAIYSGIRGIGTLFPNDTDSERRFWMLIHLTNWLMMISSGIILIVLEKKLFPDKVKKRPKMTENWVKKDYFIAGLMMGGIIAMITGYFILAYLRAIFPRYIRKDLIIFNIPYSAILLVLYLVILIGGLSGILGVILEFIFWSNGNDSEKDTK